VAKFTGIRAQLLGLVAAAVVPFLVLIGAGLWNQSRTEQAEAMSRALAEARVLAAQLDDHLGNLENLMLGLSRAVSTNPADAAANDALLRGVKAELPRFISDITVAAPDGETIGTASGQRFSVGDRRYFMQVLAGEPIAVGDPVPSRTDSRWVFPVARPIRNSAGELEGVLIVGTSIEAFRDLVRVGQLPVGSIVRIINDRGIGVAAFPDVPDWVGRDLSTLDSAARHLRTREGSDFTTWNDHPRHRLFDRLPRALAGERRPPDGGRLRGGGDQAQMERTAQSLRHRRRVDHCVDAVGPHHSPVAPARAGCGDPGGGRIEPSHLDLRGR
jgi:hypothetical protein